MNIGTTFAQVTSFNYLLILVNTCRNNLDNLLKYDTCKYCNVDNSTQTSNTDRCLVCYTTDLAGAAVYQYTVHPFYNSYVRYNILNECSTTIPPAAGYALDLNFASAPSGSTTFYSHCFENCATCSSITTHSKYALIDQCTSEVDGTMYDMAYKWTTPAPTDLPKFSNYMSKTSY